MAAVTRTATEWLLVDMAAASVHRYADAQFGRAGRGGIYLHEKTPKTAFATDALSTSETIRVSGSLRAGASDALMVDMAAVSANRYADAQFSRAWRNVGLYFHSAHSVSSFAWDSLHTSETTGTGAIRRSAFESLRIDEAAVTLRRYADAQFSSGWRNPGIYIHGLGPVRSCVESLVISQSVSRTLLTGRFVTDSLTISESAQSVPYRFATDTLTISESATAGFARIRSTTDTLSVSEFVSRVGVFKRSCSESLGTIQSVMFFGGEGRVPSESLVVSESLRRIAHLHRSASEALSTSESATANVAAHVIARTANEVLTITLVAFFREALGRNPTEFLQISDDAEVEGANKTRRAVEFLHISELATRVRLAGPFVYLLPFPTGNLPVESNLVAQIATGDFRIVDDLDHDVVTISVLVGPISDGALVAWVSSSQLAVQEADSILSMQVAASALAVEQAISSLIMQKSDGNLQYVQ
jgi:hypothetical protein